MKLGVVPRKSIICKMPILRNDLIRHYLRGYFDGDGCITGNKKQHIAIVGGNDMLTYFQVFLSKHEIVSLIYDINHSRAKELDISSKESIKNFKYLIYKDATIYLDRKFKKFNCPA